MRPICLALPLLPAALALALALAVPAEAAAIRVDARPLPLDYDDAERQTVGKLRYRGGLVLTSPDKNFGGLSALLVSLDGRHLLAVSDKGYRFTARPVMDAAGRLAGLRDAALGALGGPDGRPFQARRERDAESLAPGTSGDIIVAFEHHHRLLRYLPGEATPEPLPAPAELAGAPRNKGIEALALLADGRLLAITERFGDDDAVIGWVSNVDGWSVLTYETPDGFSPTGAATLPNGDVLVLERNFSFPGAFTARLRIITGGDIEPGARLRARTVATMAAPLNVDNFEGVAVGRGSRGETLVYIVSDDNYNVFQRTLLMMFELVE